jgi:hypothetical protein
MLLKIIKELSTQTEKKKRKALILPGGGHLSRLSQAERVVQFFSGVYMLIIDVSCAQMPPTQCT